ncbi:MAG: FAD-binding oxidoreductase [Theionarchaea archaeon]|nr:FAD-binding oxidoreductase [Theionarchaea archaeon]MBU7001139.1 FAD-binding oxidoreductase [Theionarchaea archaeon]MBU7019918.1 FAD-binding oxidoreductase [Theionarchaea archaeon]MBU7035383.1 FAD-binding oxidoreductase [Theionarchaea archaeon]MBU7039545.1 FAD-binding oxidoreductase [Theionarchaea archaeon]
MSSEESAGPAHSPGYEIVYPQTSLSTEKKERILANLQKIVGKRNVSCREIDRLSYSRDYWPIALRWMLEGKVPALPDFVVWPETTDHISHIVRIASEEKIPVVPFGEGSGVLGGAIPVQGGIVLDMKKMSAVLTLNDDNLTITVQPGINGMNLERFLNQKGYTMGHIPQSLYCSTVGGWLGCRAAGQFSTKYGKIDDILISLEAVLPQGTIIRSKPVPKSSTCPRIDTLLLGAEGTLGVITEATFKIWPYPEKRALQSYAFSTLKDGLESVRTILRRGIFPAVVRLYDQAETERHFYSTKKARGKCILILVEEGDRELVDLEEAVSHTVCTDHGGFPTGEAPAAHWMETRFNVKEISEFTPRDVVFDTIEVSVMWDKSMELYQSVISAMKSIEGVIIASAHASHFYPQGVCFYFTFGGTSLTGSPTDFYETVWNAAMKACLNAGGSISHHHGIGILRSRWIREELGPSHDILKSIKKALDPENVMNPGKMGL